MLTVHHLGKSQSERIVWLCEELGIPYQLKNYAPDHAPMVTAVDVALPEAGAVVEYIPAGYGKGRLVLAADHPDFAHFLYWFHFANGTLQAGMGRLMILTRLKLAED